MPITITNTPEVQVNSDSDTVSRYFSVNRPILFTAQRDADFSFTVITVNSSTVATVTATGFGAAWSSTLESGVDFEIYISGSDFPDGYYTVISTITAGSNSFVIDITGMGYTVGSGPFTGGDLKITRLNYRIKTKITVDSVVVATIINRVDTSYNSTINVAPFLRSLLTYDDDYNYSSINAQDLSRCNAFTLTFAEAWNGYEGSYDAEGTSTYYYVNAVHQLHHQYNGNMGEFVPFSNYDADDVRAKFLSDFETPTYFEGYPFSLDFIFNNDLDVSTYDYKRFEKQLDVNESTVSTANETLLETEKSYVNRMKLTGSYNSSTKYLDVWIEKAGAS